MLALVELAADALPRQTATDRRHWAAIREAVAQLRADPALPRQALARIPHIRPWVGARHALRWCAAYTTVDVAGERRVPIPRAPGAVTHAVEALTREALTCGATPAELLRWIAVAALVDVGTAPDDTEIDTLITTWELAVLAGEDPTAWPMPAIEGSTP